MTYRQTPGMSTTRRPLGTGPAVPSADSPTTARLLPVERVDVDDDQEHDDPGPEKAGAPAPGRRRLGDGRGQTTTAS